MSFELNGTKAEAASGIEEHIPARTVARLLGVKVGTLAKWRYLGKGPRSWVRVSQTLVVYPVAEIKRFVAERRNDERG